MPSYRGQGERHAQRQYPQTKHKPLPTGSNTAWMSAFIPYLEGLTTALTTESLLVLPLGSTAAEREQRLRQLSQMGILKMSAIRVGGGEAMEQGSEFSHYEWTVV